MAELHIIGQILRAIDFNESNSLFCRYSLQSGVFMIIITFKKSADILKTCINK